MLVPAQEPISHFYAPGHSARELDQLSVQARMYEPFTRQLFQSRSLRPGGRRPSASAPWPPCFGPPQERPGWKVPP